MYCGDSVTNMRRPDTDTVPVPDEPMPLVPAQSVAARAALDLSVRDFAADAGVGVNTVNRFETGKPVKADSVQRMRDAFELKGIVFLDDDGSGPGLRFKVLEPHHGPA